MGHAQQEGSRNDGLPLIDSEIRVLTDSVGPNAKVKQPGGRVFDTAPMPNLYQRDYAVAMPNAYQGDNCIPMPNAYQVRPDRFIMRVDGAGGSLLERALMAEKLRELDERLPKAEEKPEFIVLVT